MKEINFNELKQESIVLYLKESIRSSFNNEEFNWEFKSLNGNVVFKLYTDNEHIVASQAMLPIKLLVNNKVTETAKSETSFLNQLYRGHNHFEKLYFSTIEASQKNGVQLIWGFTPAVKVWKKKLNFDIVTNNISEATITLSKYPSNLFLKKYVSNKIKCVFKILIFSFLRLFEKKVNYPITKTDVQVSTVFPKEEVLQDFQKELSRKFNINVYLKFNNEYINWRIKTNPLLKYQSCFFYQESNLVGYIIFSIKDERLSIADISYLETNTASHMLNYILSQYSKNINSVFYFGNDDSEFGENVFNIFEKFNAKIVKSNWANTVIKDVSFDNKYKDVLDPTTWLINGLWTEGFSI